ncbi:Mbeg1-like protein [Aquimarina megaterium]|uniref:Mbeg1-like protein n=1 Tax=Aquimarina megaterium TaxID=1443666 RepID=UPI00046FA874|nr:Mbeg1-like protein [Aquimarina megaterium]
MGKYKYIEGTSLPIEKIWKQDIALEVMAHNLVYLSPKDKNDKKKIQNIKGEYGLSKVTFFKGKEGFEMVGIRPGPSSDINVNVIAFRGTEPSISDIKSDINKRSVGKIQYDKNENEIKKWVKNLGSKGIILTGHSLGGALAQLTASLLPIELYQNIDQIVTFQSPGIHFSDLDPKKDYISVHYRMKDALVDKAGYVFTSGIAYTLNFLIIDREFDHEFKFVSPMFDAIIAHTYFPLSRLHAYASNKSVDINQLVNSRNIDKSEKRTIEEIRPLIYTMIITALDLIEASQINNLNKLFISMVKYYKEIENTIKTMNKILNKKSIKNTSSIEKVFLSEILLHLFYFLNATGKYKFTFQYQINRLFVKRKLETIIMSLTHHEFSFFFHKINQINVFPSQKQKNAQLLGPIVRNAKRVLKL